MEVVCLGILVADVFAQPVSALPQPGELKTTDGFLHSAGGCAANVAVNLRRLGRSVSVVGKVGQDSLGQFVVDELGRQGIGTGWIRRSATQPTSATVILNVRGEDRRYLHCIGANRDFCAADVSPGVLQGATVLYVGGYMAMPGFSGADLQYVFRAAKQAGLTTVLDVVIPAGTSGAAEHVLPALPYTDYFLPNNDEARLLTGLSTAMEQARELAHCSPLTTVVVTLGAGGSLAVKGDHIVQTAAFPMDSIDESGAGDAFAAGLIVGILESWPLEFTLQFAAGVGASCTRAVGCSAGVFGFPEAIDYLKQRGISLGKMPVRIG
jgi:sugar/nucleoside kinase (ribokinase family)